MDNLDKFSASTEEKEAQIVSRPQASLSDISPDSPLLPATPRKPKGKGPLIALICAIVVILVTTGVGAAAYFGYIELPINIPFIQPDPQQVVRKMYLKMSELKSVGYGAEMKMDIRTQDSAGIDAPAEEVSEYGLTTKRTPKNLVYSGVISVEGESDWNDKENVKFNSKMETSFVSSEASMLLGASDDFKLGFETKGDKKINYFKITEMPALPFFDLSGLVNKWIKIDYSTGTMSQLADLEARIEDVKERSSFTPEQEKQIKEVFVKSDILKVVKKFPEEKIGETAVYHYRFNFDKNELKRAVEEANKIANDKIIPEDSMVDFYQGVDSLNMLDGEMWIGKNDSYLYRFSVASSTYGGETGEKMFMGISLVLNLNKFNEPVTIEAPAEAMTIEEIIKSIFDPVLSDSRAVAADAKRLSDIRMVQTALNLYYNDNGHYPDEIDFDGTGSIKTATTTYMMIVPSNPEPRDEGGCDDENYSYTVAPDGQDYQLRYCLGEETDSVPAGKNIASYAGISEARRLVEPISDSDNDGLTDYEETNIYHTDPSNSDTDGDGFNDGAEVQGGYNPNGPGKLPVPAE